MEFFASPPSAGRREGEVHYGGAGRAGLPSARAWWSVAWTPAMGNVAFIGFQTLDKGLRAFFIFRQGQKRITLAAVQHRPRLLPPLFKTIARGGISRRRRAGRIECSPLLDVPRLHEVPQQRHHALELVRQVGQPLRRIVCGLASFPWHGCFVPERTIDGKEKARGNRWQDIRFMNTADAFLSGPVTLSRFHPWRPPPCPRRFRGTPAGTGRGLWCIWPPSPLHARPYADPDSW